MNEATVFEKDQDSFVKTIRSETAESHQQLEDNPISKALLDPDVTLADYQTYLSKLYGITLACENDVFPAISGIFPDLDKRYKSSLILKDLQNTGYSADQIAALPVTEFDFETAGEAAGIMYVMEGSTLGGKVIYKHIHDKLGLNPENGGAYFWGYGDQTGVLWKTFISTLTQFADSDNNDHDIIASAKNTFTIINSWLSGRNN